jgi:nitroreductase
MNEVIRTINERRAVRRYKTGVVERTMIEMLLDAGRMAPSGVNQQPWKFYVLTGANLISNFDKLIKEAAEKLFTDPHATEFLKIKNPIFHGAPVVIFITSPKVGSEWVSLDIGMCSQNIMLAAKSLGLDTCPVGLGKFVEKTSLYPVLKIPSSEQVQLCVIVGYGNESPAIPEREKENVVYIERTRD